MISLKQANYLTEDYEDGKAYIFYKHMRTPGIYENFYKIGTEQPRRFPDQG